jgi:hypothetical protein
MTFTDAAPSLERGLTAAGGNCCITFHRSSKIDEERRRQKAQAWLGFAMMVCVTLILMSFAWSGRRHGPAPDIQDN